MATGYTYPVKDGTDTLKEMLTSMARGMGAYIHQRDDDEQGLKKRGERSFYGKTYNEYVRKYNAMAVWSETDIVQHYLRAKAEYEKSRKDYLATIEKERERYLKRIAEVEALDWPEDDDDTGGFWAGYRKFVIEQLESSLKFDCPDKPSIYRESFEEIYPLPIVWYEEEIGQIRRMRESYRKYYEEELDRVWQQNKIHEQLTDFLSDL
jgi:hypothetical protein